MNGWTVSEMVNNPAAILSRDFRKQLLHIWPPAHSNGEEGYIGIKTRNKSYKKYSTNISTMKTSNNMNRRKFLRNTAAGATAVGLSSPAMKLMANPLKGKIKNKVGLYSITFLGVWYKGKAMALDDMIVTAKELGYDGIEIDGKRPHGNPLDMPADRCKELKSKADDLGMEIYAVSANNDFSSPIPEYRECQIVYLRELMRMTSDLGAVPLRVFLGWPGVTLHPEGGRYDIAKDIWQHTHYQFEPEQIWDWCREGLIESARYAGDFGVTLALQNHKPVINDWRDMMRMIREVDSPNLKACLDAPIMDDKSPENMMEAARAVGDLQMLTHFGGEFGRNTEGKVIDNRAYQPGEVDYEIQRVEDYLPNFVKAMNSIGYEGWYSYELCHPLPIVNGEKVKIDFVENCAGLACELMNGILDS
jgi:sugar phosphate isomerase/epimerase